MNKQNQSVALVLGGTVPHCELIRQLQARGYYVILIDYLADSPAKAVADEHIRESTLDKEKVLEVARERDAQLVISGCVEHANVTACYVMEQLGKRPPYSYGAAVKATDKGSMKRIMVEAGIPTSKYILVDSVDAFKREGRSLRFPIVIKPVDGNSSNGVKKATALEEAVEYIPEAIKLSRSGKIIVEEFISGKEISAYCFIKDKRAKLLLTAERISTIDGAEKAIKCFASIAPAKISRAAEIHAERIATQIAEAFALDNTALFFQGLVSGDEINVIEFGARIGGGACFKTIHENTGFDAISAIIDTWEGKPVDFSAYHAPTRILAVNTIYGKNGVFDHVEGAEKLLARGDAVGFYQIRTCGDRIDNSKASTSRIAFCVISAADKAELLHKVQDVYRTVKVLDANGNDMIRKDLNLENHWGDYVPSIQEGAQE